MTSIAVVVGDGIGQEVIPVAQDVLSLLHPEYEFYPVEIGYGKWKKTGVACTPDDIVLLRDADAIIFGAVTTPPAADYRSVVLEIRKELDLYANLRPIKGDGVDIMIVRENTEGLYSGIEWQEDDRASTLRVITRKGSERIARAACRIARERGNHLTIGNKANVIKSDAFFRDICIKTAEEEGVPYTTAFIDALTLDVLMHPERYDVIVTTNIFGDILSDAAAYLVGGLGMLPSANIGDSHALFEPVHGSAPDIAGKGIANPVAAIRSAAMLLSHLGDIPGATLIEEAIRLTAEAGITTPDTGGKATTKEAGAAVIDALLRITEDSKHR
ncbi:isocitrate/isopropylmalate dehydrogenase family protein [Methanogenium marinum]|uniref:Isocitrate/isopropylmalate dehydrogenase family protein n=1 Tax=Methanogenium marinum TaxID=348610 RepID=A0A9Q4PVU1_9EURY|nr:isocitrate/isopropylmalate dehydrogenase family protein [Methanogenium marinum]MDE4907929.1 isocitrate/isopropylmalate dehydrogenase family protein [Methanogenium marinum]